MKKLLFSIIIAILFSCSPKKTTWVAIGDSITYLNEHTDETGNRVTKGYMTLVAEQLPEITYINQGHNGWTSGNIADSIETLGLVRADVYSIFLGTNDWWQGRPVGTLADYQNNAGNNTVFGSFRIIVNKLKSINPKAQIILITPLKRVDFVQVGNLKNIAWGSYRDKNGQMLSEFAAAIRLIGETEHFDVVDLYTEPRLSIEKLVKFKYLRDTLTGEYKNYRYPDFIPIPFNPETDEYPYPMESIDMTYDGLHPSDAGYKIIAERLVEILQK